MPLTAGIYYGFKVKARNTVGSSLASAPVFIIAATYPNAPINVQNVPAQTTGYQISLTWSEGVYNGGSPVIDY